MPLRAATAQSRSQPAGSTAPGGSGVKAGLTSGSAIRRASPAETEANMPKWLAKSAK